MRSKTRYRLLIVFLLIVSTVPLVQGAVSTTTTEITDRYESARGEVAEPREGITVITTSPRSSSDGSLIALSPDGRVLYYNETYEKYFDVDPVSGTQSTIEFVAKHSLEEQECPPTASVCAEAVVEQINLSTGKTVNRIVFAAERRNDWHDVDRLDEHRLLVADINNRIFIYNTSTGVITWSYEFRADWNRSTGGVYPDDWTHLNDVEYVGDGKIMASPRNQDRVVFIDVEKGLLSNKTLGEENNHSILYEQHNPDYISANRGGPSVLVADSENNRVVEYQRENGEWEQSWQWADVQLAWPRDADRLPNGNTLITDSNGGRVLEINQNGEIVWSVDVDTPYEAERLGTGDESSQGYSAAQLGLTGSSTAPTAQNVAKEASRNRPLHLKIVFAIRGVIPSPVLNGLLFILPPWVGIAELLSGLTIVALLSVWSLIELYWSGYRVRRPIYQKTTE